MTAIGIDIGGTQTRVGAVTRSGRVLACRRYRTNPDGGGDALVGRLIRELAAVREEAHLIEPFAGVVGLALPGVIDRRTNTLIRSVNLPFLEGRRIGEQLTRRAGLSPKLITDADATTWAEYVAHPARPTRFAHLRLGTGIACGVVIDGALQDLCGERSAHLDVLVIDEGRWARECRCGRRGCLETVASGAALIAHGQDGGFAADLQNLRGSWLRGDEPAKRVIGEAAAAVSTAVGNLARHFGVEMVSLGGGVVDQLPCLFDETVACFRSRRVSESGDLRISIERSRLGDDAGVVGAALLAFAEREGTLRS